MSTPNEYWKFTTKARLDKSINTLLGLMEGIAIDSKINQKEISLLDGWIADHAEVESFHPYNEFIPVLRNALCDGILTSEERENVIWLCERLQSNSYYDSVAAGIQRMHAILAGIVADGVITDEELEGLSQWIQNHEHLKTCWPYDEVESLVFQVRADKKIDADEHAMLLNYFSSFSGSNKRGSGIDDIRSESVLVQGICAVCPEIEFTGEKFCFSGESAKYPRKALAEMVERNGGLVCSSVSRFVRYLIIGADGNPCWAFSCYGRKIEKAIELRKSGAKIVLVHENDFHDAIADRF